MSIRTVCARVFTLLASCMLITNATDVFAESNCPDSTEVLEPIFGWDIPAAGFDIVVGSNRLVYVTDPVNDRIYRYNLYGDEEMFWESADPPDPGSFGEPRWLAWNPINDRLYVCGQLNTPARVPVFGASGNFVFDIESDTLSTQPGKFAGPVGPIAIDPVTGFVWIYENNVLSGVTARRIQEFNLSGEYTGRVFNIGVDCMTQGSGTKAVIDMAIDSTGSVYLLESRSSMGVTTSQVHRIVPGVGCAPHWEGGPGQLGISTSIAIDKDGHVNVLDQIASGTRVRKYGAAGGLISSQTIGALNQFSLALEFMRDAADPFMFVARRLPSNQVAVYGMGIDPRNVLATSWVDDETFQLETDNLEKLAECAGSPQDPRIDMTGVAADGVAPILLRLHLPESGTVRWKLADPTIPVSVKNLARWPT